jgi:hypothetical protein
VSSLSLNDCLQINKQGFEKSGTDAKNFDNMSNAEIAEIIYQSLATFEVILNVSNQRPFSLFLTLY